MRGRYAVLACQVRANQLPDLLPGLLVALKIRRNLVPDGVLAGHAIAHIEQGTHVRYVELIWVRVIEIGRNVGEVEVRPVVHRGQVETVRSPTPWVWIGR